MPLDIAIGLDVSIIEVWYSPNDLLNCQCNKTRQMISGEIIQNH